MKNPSRLGTLLLFPVLILSGCASISVSKIKTVANQSFVAPKKVYVREFTGPESVFRVDRKGDSLKEFRTKTAKQLSDDLAKKLNESVIPAEALASNSRPPKGNHWLVTGTFDRVNQGSRALRTLFGLGFGGTKIETTVHVASLSTGKPVEILSFRTSGGSNTEPGPGILMGPPDPTTILPLLWGVAMPGLTRDITRTAKEIAAEISDYLAKHGVTPKDPKLKVKLMRGPKA
jgi:hypothetical protein